MNVFNVNNFNVNNFNLYIFSWNIFNLNIFNLNIFNLNVFNLNEKTEQRNESRFLLQLDLDVQDRQQLFNLPAAEAPVLSPRRRPGRSLVDGSRLQQRLIRLWTQGSEAFSWKLPSVFIRLRDAELPLNLTSRTSEPEPWAEPRLRALQNLNL